MTSPGRLRNRRLACVVSAAMQRLVMLLLILGLGGSTLGACSAAATGQPIPGTGPLVTVQMRGGLCPEGPCDTRVLLERDGRVHSAAKPPNDLGVVTAATMSTLSVAIAATDFSILKAKPFTGQCPTAFDGQELVFEFATIGGTQRVASCEVDIDWGHPLFIAVAAALGEWIPLPLT